MTSSAYFAAFFRLGGWSTSERLCLEQWSRPHISQHSFRRHEWTWMQRFRATSRDPSPNRPMSSLGQHFSQINLKKKQKNKPYKAFSRYRTDLSLVGLNSFPAVFFLKLSCSSFTIHLSYFIAQQQACITDCSNNLYAGLSSYLLILFSALSAFAVVG